MFSTLELTTEDVKILLFIIIVSFSVMIILESFVFFIHLQPIRSAFKSSFQDQKANELALHQLYRFPILAVKRTLLPHLFGLSVPAMTLAHFFIKNNSLSLPSVYIFYAFIASILVASMHALFEFYLTTNAIQPISIFLKDILHDDAPSIAMPTNSGVRVKVKFRASVLLISIFPIILFVLAGQVKLENLTGEESLLYWKWAGLILIVTFIYAVLVSRFMAKDIEEPISHLLRMMKDVENQKYGYLKTNVYTDEFSYLFSGFNKMISEIQHREEENRQLLESYLTVLSAALDARDPYTAGHSMRVATYSKRIGIKLDLNEAEVDRLNRSALLHDIGKIGVPDYVLLKDGKLTDEEYEQIKAHPVIGERILKQVEPADKMIGLLPGVRSHHERVDGRGYPDRLSGNNIPLFGRIIAVADAFDAMTSDRPYRKGMEPGKAIKILQEGKGIQWDADIVDAFLEVFDEKATISDSSLIAPEKYTNQSSLIN
ncbi:HD domain-containing phosphohydrolase [Bacillus sp. UNCCL13]|nr:HD domain-containing phosphohydrolase [Bacillus sp. UNCCL13]